MFGRVYKYLIMIVLGVGLLSPAYSDDFNNSQNYPRISLQEEFGDYMQGVRDKISNTWTPPDMAESAKRTIFFIAGFPCVRYTGLF